MVGASRIWKVVTSNLLREYDVDLCWDLRSIFCDGSRQASSFVRSTAVCSATFRRDLLLQLLNPYHVISAVTALHAAAHRTLISITRVPGGYTRTGPIRLTGRLRAKRKRVPGYARVFGYPRVIGIPGSFCLCNISRKPFKTHKTSTHYGL